MNVSDKWFSLRGCENEKGQFEGEYISRDSLIIVATVQYKRFLNFLWKTNKVKNREVDIVSKKSAYKDYRNLHIEKKEKKPMRFSRCYLCLCYQQILAYSYICSNKHSPDRWICTTNIQAPCIDNTH